MDTPCSSGSSPPDLTISTTKKCPVCYKPPHGIHFGAYTCRACAVFFRRFGASNNLKPCKKNNVCDFDKNGYVSCKKCRLKKCFDIGMKIENFQFERDPYKRSSICISLAGKIPPTLETFLARPSLIILTAPSEDTQSPRVYIDVKFLVDKSYEELLKGFQTPIQAPNILKKLALGLQQVRGSQRKVTKRLKKFGKYEMFAMWENDMLKVAKWFTYFEDFQKFSFEFQIDIIKKVWIVWNGLEKLATTAKMRRRTKCDDILMVLQMENDLVACGKSVEFDLSWCSNYKAEQFAFIDSNWNKHEELLELMVQLNPTDEELCYMLCHLCFQQISKQCDGHILETVEQLQDSISNHLHDYYLNNLFRPNYSGRIAIMMKLNNNAQQFIYRDHINLEILKVFDAFFVNFSHPELFMNYR